MTVSASRSSMRTEDVARPMPSGEGWPPLSVSCLCHGAPRNLLFTASALLACLSLRRLQRRARSVDRCREEIQRAAVASGGGSDAARVSGGDTVCTGARRAAPLLDLADLHHSRPGIGGCEIDSSYKTSDGKSFQCDCSGVDCSKAAPRPSSSMCIAAAGRGAARRPALPRTLRHHGSSYQQCTTVSAGRAVHGHLAHCSRTAPSSPAQRARLLQRRVVLRHCQGTGTPVTTCTHLRDVRDERQQHEECRRPSTARHLHVLPDASDLARPSSARACGNAQCASTSMESTARACRR